MTTSRTDPHGGSGIWTGAACCCWWSCWSCPRSRSSSVVRSPRSIPILESALFHIYVVSAIAACALFVALATASYAVRDGRAAPVLIALGCVAVGFMMLGHGLTHAGHLRPADEHVGRPAPGAGARDVRRLSGRRRATRRSRSPAWSPGRLASRWGSRRHRSRSPPRPSRSIRPSSGVRRPCPARTQITHRAARRERHHAAGRRLRSTGGAGASAGTGSSSRWSSRAG